MTFAIGYARLGSPEVAEEAFVEAYRHLSNIEKPAAFPGWFRTILFGRCRQVLRRK
jgi:DNA-directed RNA polymerase specialized sigma24 family protein